LRQNAPAVTLLQERRLQEFSMEWPNGDDWKALADGEIIERWGIDVEIAVVDCGELVLPYGRLLICDPFIFMRPTNATIVTIPPGRYPLKVTIADVSGQRDGSHVREAYATLLLAESEEIERRFIQLFEEGQPEPGLDEGEFLGFAVDAATACFVDDGAITSGMPADESKWHDEIFENSSPESWISRMDDPTHIRPGLANVPLPFATDGSNAILMHSGRGDGIFPVIGGYDKEENLVRIHVDFNLI
jgi:Protein of unknown function (DUF4241)